MVAVAVAVVVTEVVDIFWSRKAVEFMLCPACSGYDAASTVAEKTHMGVAVPSLYM